MMKWMNKFEKGQMIVILVVGITVLLGFTALTVDFGQYYSDRRHDQNAADDTALAGASKAGDVMSANFISVYNFSCSNPGVISAMSAAVTAAQARALENNFTIGNNLDTKHGVEVTCDPTGNYLKIDVMVTSDVNTSFAQLIFSSVLRNTVEAVTIIEPGTGLGEGQAIVALNQEDCDSPSVSGLVFGGSSEIFISNSGAHSNTCLKCDGGVLIDAAADLEWIPDTLTDTNCESGNIIGSGQIEPTDHMIDPPSFDVDCGYGVRTDFGKVKVNNKNSIEPLSPGNYESITLLNGEITLEPGLYCVSKGITMNSGIIRVLGDDDDDDGVTIYSNDTISITGGMAYLRAPRSDWKYTKPASYSHAYPTIPGLLIYLDEAPANATITINGNGDSYFRGTIYYPDGLITINGNSEQVDWLVEVIGYEVNVSGTANTYITYNGGDVHSGFPYISVLQ